MTLAVFIKTPGGEHRSKQAIQKRNEKRSQGKAGRQNAAVAAAHSPGTFANPEWEKWNVWNEDPSAVAEKSSSSSWDFRTHHSWQIGAKDSSAVEVWHSHPTSPSHTDQGWHEGGWKGCGESNETSSADQWVEVWDTYYPSEWSNNPPTKVEYNSITDEYRYQFHNPAHRAWPKPYTYASR